MPPPARIIRSVKDIRTHFGSPEQTNVPFKIYMVITALEMEQYRREKERDALRLRLTSIENRLLSLEKEKAALLDRVARKRDIEKRRASYAERTTPGKIPQAPLHQRGETTGGIKFKY